MPIALRRPIAETVVGFAREGDPALWPQKGHWRAIRTDQGERKAIICCPKCANQIGLRQSSIYQDGTVSPPISCRCGVMGTAKLQGWVPG